MKNNIFVRYDNSLSSSMRIRNPNVGLLFVRPIFLIAFLLLEIGCADAVDMVRIPAGEFVMGCSFKDNACDDDEGFVGGKSVYVPEFYIDAHEVTVAIYRQCVANGKCRAPKTHVLNKYCNYNAPGRDHYPVNCIDWQDAVNFCVSQHKRLPKEAEWEKAARAGSTSRFIWNTQPDCRQAIFNDEKTKGSVVNEYDGCGEDRTWKVGSRTPNAYGLYDMFGNVSEWVQNWYEQDALNHYALGNLDAPANGTRKVIRGGAWDESVDALRASSRFAKPPVSGKSVWGSNGFRCASDTIVR